MDSLWATGRVALNPIEDAAASLDTFAVGDRIAVITPAGQAEAVRPLIAGALARVEARVGSLPAGDSLPLSRVYLGPPSPGRGSSWVRLDERRRGDPGARLEAAIGSELGSWFPADVRRWTSAALVGISPDSEGLYRELAGSPLFLVQECFQGSGSSCLVAAGLAPLDTARLTADERREVAHEMAGPRPPQELGDDRLAFLSPLARAALLQHLLGGHPGALERLMGADDGAGAAEALELAAGRPLETVAAQWSAAVRRARPERALAGPAVTALFWTLLFAGLATRSTRWRTP
jgi:hypothetical protein